MCIRKGGFGERIADFFLLSSKRVHQDKEDSLRHQSDHSLIHKLYKNNTQEDAYCLIVIFYTSQLNNFGLISGIEAESLSV